MSQLVLAMYDVRGIQKYIFRTAKVQDATGASAIVEDIILEALKMIRNRINHASTAEMDADERNAIRRLKEDHGIRVEKEFGQVKSLMYQGLKKPAGVGAATGTV